MQDDPTHGVVCAQVDLDPRVVLAVPDVEQARSQTGDRIGVGEDPVDQQARIIIGRPVPCGRDYLVLG